MCSLQGVGGSLTVNIPIAPIMSMFCRQVKIDKTLTFKKHAGLSTVKTPNHSSKGPSFVPLCLAGVCGHCLSYVKRPCACFHLWRYTP